jgi:hypothetical protein
LDDRRNPSVGPNEAFQQGLIRFDGTLEAHQVDLYLSRNANVGFELPCRQNCGRGGPVMTRGVGPQRPSVGRLSIEIMYPKPCSNKRSGGWCATTISSSGAARDPVANGRPEPAFYGAVPNGVNSRPSAHPVSTLLPLRALLPGASSQENPLLCQVSRFLLLAPPCWSWTLGRT